MTSDPQTENTYTKPGTDKSNTPTEVPNGFIELRSPYRPYPIGAKRELQAKVETAIFPSDERQTAYVSSKPDDEILSEWELHIVRHDSPEEVWETKNDDKIAVYEDRVEQNGEELGIEPSEAKEKAREQDYFTRVENTSE